MKPTMIPRVTTLLVCIAIQAIFSRNLTAQNFTFLAEQTEGLGDAVVQVDVISPEETTGDNYRVFFTEENGQIFLSIENLNTQLTAVARSLLETPFTSREFEGITVIVTESPPNIKDILEVQYGDTPVDPPVHIFRPGDLQHEGGNNSTNEYTFVGGFGKGDFENIRPLIFNAAPFDYEIRFDGDPSFRNKFIYVSLLNLNSGIVNVPFSVWNTGIGTPDDTTDDEQIIAVGVDQVLSTLGFRGGLPPGDGGPGTMYDLIYVYDLNRGALPEGDVNDDGVVTYDDLLQDISNRGPIPIADDILRATRYKYVGNEVIARLGMVSLSGNPFYLPPIGTTIRITTTKPPAGGDIYEFSSPDFGLFTNPVSLDFGNVRVNSLPALPLTIVNDLHNDITVSDILVDSPLFQVSRTNFTLAPGDSSVIDVVFVATVLGEVQANLTIISDDPFFPEYRISVRAKGLNVLGAVDLLGSLTVPGESATDVWGYFDENTGIEYALVGMSPGGVAIVDVSKPEHPELVSTITSIPGFDVKAWKNYMYSVTGGGSGFGRIVDITDPVNPRIVGSFSSSHNITISDSGYMYLSLPGLRIYDLNTDPTNPVLVWRGGTEGHDVTVVGNRMYDFHGGSLNPNNKITNIYDVTDPTNPQLLGSITDPSINFHHSGWPTEDGRYLFICDEGAAHPIPDITVWDISDYGNPQKVGEISDPRATVHNLTIIGNVAYTSYYAAGFRIFDVSDPTQSILIDEIDTNSNFSKEVIGIGAWGVYPFTPSGNVYVSDTITGLHIFSVKGVREIRGDVTEDGVVNVRDLIRVIRIVLGIGGEPTQAERTAADVNEDGLISVVDLIAIINIILGIG